MQTRIQMVNRLKTEGVVLMTLGVTIILVSPVLFYSSPDVSHLDAVGFGLGEAIGLVLIALGAWPYYLGWKIGKKET